ncbi:MAG: ribose utilization transcriptional repressor RbsR [Vagococcus sp.]
MTVKKSTIKDVAKLSGVSITTVSLILNGNAHKFASETVEKVLKAKEELNYQPNYFAQQMIVKETKTIGVLVPDITNPFFSTLMQGIEDILYQENFVTILCNATFNQQKEEDYLAELARRGVDGFIIATSSISNEAINESLKSKGRPFIVLDQKKAEGFSDAVLTDDFKGGYLAGKHLLKHGHRQIGVILPTDLPDNIKLRMDGFKKACREFYLAETDIHLFYTKLSKNGGYHVTNDIIDSPVTAIFTINDELAFGLYRGLHEAGKKIPRDYSIIGYDNTDMCEYVTPKLTTIAQPIYELGQITATMLLERIRQPKKEWEDKTLQVELIERASTTIYQKKED